MNALKDKAREMKKKGGDDRLVVDEQEESLNNAAPAVQNDNHGAQVLRAEANSGPHSESVEPEPLDQGEPLPDEGEALRRFSSYWLRRSKG